MRMYVRGTSTFSVGMHGSLNVRTWAARRGTFCIPDTYLVTLHFGAER
jgi:hypothetical protein